MKELTVTDTTILLRHLQLMIYERELGCKIYEQRLKDPSSVAKVGLDVDK